MPIFVNGQEIKINNNQSSEKPTREIPAQQYPQTDDHHVLIVNGQAKKVAKRSQYMLDMLTIDSE